MRQEFIDLLIQYGKGKAHNITAVFDGHKSGAGVENREVRGGITVIYSRLGECADDVIKRIISRERREWIVITSDRAIVNHAWSVDSIPVPSDRFLEIISKQVHTQKSAEEAGQSWEERSGDIPDKDADEDFEDHARKGNPHQLSRKEKAVRKALSKL